MTSLEFHRQLHRNYAAIARRLRWAAKNSSHPRAKQYRRRARAYAFKALAALAMVELDISPNEPYVRPRQSPCERPKLWPDPDPT